MQPFSLPDPDNDTSHRPALRLANGDVMVSDELFDSADTAVGYAHAICDVLTLMQTKALENMGFSIQ